MGGLARWAAAGTAAAAAALCANPADAARLQVKVDPKPYAEALIDLALQAQVSLLNAQACPGGQSRGLAGSYATLEVALRTLLSGSGCSFRMVDARTVEILAPTAAEVRRGSPGPVVAELLVTATKRRIREDQIAAALSVVSGRQLAESRAHDVRDASSQVSGVITTNLGPGRDKLLLRGLSDGVFTGRARSPVASYLDDAPINYDAPDPDLRLTDVERVEVIRGPQGALYGGGSMAGVYRIVTRKPDLSLRSAEISASYADTKGGAPSSDVEGFLNLPLVKDRAGLRLAAYYEAQGGYIDDEQLRRANVDRTLRHGGRLALRIAPAEGWTLDVSVVGQHLHSSDAQYTTARVGLGRASRVAESHDNRFEEAQATLQGRLWGAELSNAVAVMRHRFSSRYDASAALGLFEDPVAELGVYDERRRVRMVVDDLVVHREGPRFGWLVGLSGAYADETSPAELEAMVLGRPLAPLYAEARTDRLLSGALYGEASYSFTPSWSVTLGGRYRRAILRVASQVNAAPPGRSRRLERRGTYGGVLPKVSIQHELAGGGLVYALYSTGVRPGGFNSAGLGPPTPARASFAPDRLRNYELGLKLNAAGERLTFRGAVFFDRWRDIQTDRYLASGLAYTANVGDAEIVGIEGEASVQITPALSLQANVLATNAWFTRRNPDFAQRLSRGLPGTPPVSGGALAIYRRPLGGGLDLRLTALARYVGHSNLNFDAALARPMGGYVDAELAAALVRGRYSAEVFVSNPADTARDTFAYGNPFSFGQVRQATPQRPRTIGLVLTARY